jgi:carbonic anhydrase
MTTAPKKLIEGFARFRARHFERNDSLYQQLVTEGQTPKIMVVACCDSRVDPALVLDCEPGDLFVVRNVANLVPPAENRAGHHGTTAAIQYAVMTLGVEHIIVFGHAHCAGIRALLQRGSMSKADTFIDDWMGLAETARASVMSEMAEAPLSEQARVCEQRAILVSLDNLTTFDWIKERVNNRSLTLHGWYFDIARGNLLSYNTNSCEFEAL